MKWQSMENAPKNGCRILVNWLDNVSIAFWNTDVPCPTWQEWPDGDFDNGGEVTHWMYLPKLPIRVGMKNTH